MKTHHVPPDLLAARSRRYLLEARARWADLSDDELRRGESQPTLLADMVQKRYAISQGMADRQVDGFCRELEL